jgi:hypothetical protein
VNNHSLKRFGLYCGNKRFPAFILPLFAALLYCNGAEIVPKSETHEFESMHQREVSIIKGMSILSYLSNGNMDPDIGEIQITDGGLTEAGRQKIGVSLKGASVVFDLESGCLISLSINEKKVGEEVAKKFDPSNLSDTVSKSKIIEKIGFNFHGILFDLTKGTPRVSQYGMQYPRVDNGLLFFDESISVFCKFDNQGVVIGIQSLYYNGSFVKKIPNKSDFAILSPEAATANMLEKMKPAKGFILPPNATNVDSIEISPLGLMHADPFCMTGVRPTRSLTGEVHLVYVATATILTMSKSSNVKAVVAFDAVTGEIVSGEWHTTPFKVNSSP